MGHGTRPDQLGTFVTVWQVVESGEETLAPTEQDRGDSDVQLIDQAGAQVGPDRCDATAQSDVRAASSDLRVSAPRPATRNQAPRLPQALGGITA